MGVKTYWLQFGTGDARTTTGLAPTFLLFFDNAGVAQSKPAISEVVFGSGAYGFSLNISSTQSIFFLAGSATLLSGSSTATANFVAGVIDPILTVDQSISGLSTNISAIGTTQIAMGATLVGIGVTLSGGINGIGSTSDSFGSTSADPGSLFGYMKRIQELLEGDQIFTASSGVWQMYNRVSFAGVTTLLRTKTILNPGSQTTKTGV